MKLNKMAMFFAVVFIIYFTGNLYICLKGYNSVGLFRSHGAVYFISFTLLAFTFIAAKIIESRHSSVFSDILNIAGGFWMAFLLYGFIFLFLSDVISLLLRLTGGLNDGNIQSFKKWSFLTTLALSSVLILGGFLNALSPVVKTYQIDINKFAGDIREVRIAAISDIHLGSIIRKRSTRKLSEMLEAVRPDLVLLLGDIVDGEMGPVLRDDLLGYFKCPDCRYGLYAITGNHEYIGGAHRTIPYIENKGIRILKDEVVTLPGGIQLVGRLDRDSKRISGVDRMALKELMNNVDTTKPVILLDHQPFNLAEAAGNGVDLQLSGHTHNGQMWPLNLLTRRIYELSYGYLKKNDTHYIVSSGFGIWGPRVRIGSRSEILLVRIRFTGLDPAHS
ncbi:MAG TPA: metallophosphoesterase [Bacteroidales bacterium]|nr:metallophosphoesterase [Bacteroidales bacterium]HNR43091.1 metallophosphoesterase [Bacteroidales bacterium]HQG76386.1 metallophosphoesterase [Bacteroidales bacterium]